MRVLLCVAVLLICHRASSFPSSLNVSKLNEDNFEKLGILKSNNYFQDAKIFYTYNITVNTPSGDTNNATTCNEKNQTIQTVQTVQAIQIPDFYTLTPGIGAHKLLTSKKNWNQARSHCIAEGAHLLVITSEEEETLIKKLLASQEIDEVWVGIHDLFKANDWITIFEQPLNSLGYAKWKEGEEIVSYLEEHCVSYQDGLKDESCLKDKAFVCKIIV